MNESARAISDDQATNEGPTELSEDLLAALSGGGGNDQEPALSFSRTYNTGEATIQVECRVDYKPPKKTVTPPDPSPPPPPPPKEKPDGGVRDAPVGDHGVQS